MSNAATIRIKPAWFSAILITCAACASDVEHHLQDGTDALAECDIRAAHEAFAKAYEADSGDARAALGFALTDLALLPEDPAVTAVLSDIGFTGAVDMQEAAFGPDGALARYARGDTCEQLEDFLASAVPYPLLGDSSIDALSLIRADMTLGDVVAGARAIEPRLGRIATALATAAAGVSEPIEIEGGCGLGTLTLQPPELYALAALLETLRAMTTLATAYDWDINLIAVFGQSSEDVPGLVDSLNQHLGHVTDAAAAEPAAARMRAALDHLLAATAVAEAITGPVEGGVFDWSQLPASLAAEITSFASSLQGVTEGRAAVAGVEPAIEIDGSVLLAAGVDLGEATAPIFSVSSDEIGNFVSTDGEALAAPFAPVVDPAPWSSLAPAYSWQLSTELDGFDPDPLVEPARRYTDMFSCVSDPML